MNPTNSEIDKFSNAIAHAVNNIPIPIGFKLGILEDIIFQIRLGKYFNANQETKEEQNRGNGQLHIAKEDDGA